MNRCWLALGLVTLSLLLSSLPDLLRQAAELVVGPVSPPWLLQARGGPYRRPVQPPAPVDSLPEESLLAQLQAGDRDWLPRAEPLGDGGIRYIYKRRPGEPELSIAEIRALIIDPPSHLSERRAIADLLALLRRSGVAVVLREPVKTGAAAEWDPQQRTLRIRPDIPGRGSIEFAQVLNHEAIHVAQSCAAGALDAPPQLLGISTALTPALAAQLREPLYANASEAEKSMEREAYAHQERLGVGLALVKQHCRDGLD
ncbi:MAG: hypothetical protein WAM11_12050 [Cyanobium sp.]